MIPTTTPERMGPPDGALDLGGVFRLAQRKWKVVSAATLLAGALAAGYAWSVAPRYAAEVVLMPREVSPASGVLSQLGQLGGLAGIVGAGASSKGRDEAIAVLRSRAFVRSFIEKQGIRPALDAASRPLISLGARHWTTEDAVEYFDTAVRSVYEDKKSGEVKITVEWTDAAMAARWANLMAAQLNETTREQALEESGRNISYLTSELEKSKFVALTNSIASLLENEFKRAMVARGATDYSFKVVDPAVAPVNRSYPKRTLLTLLGAMLGFAVSMVVLFVRQNLAPASARG